MCLSRPPVQTRPIAEALDDEFGKYSDIQVTPITRHTTRHTDEVDKSAALGMLKTLDDKYEIYDGERVRGLKCAV